MKSLCKSQNRFQFICLLLLGLYHHFTLFLVFVCRPRSDFESFLNIGIWFKKYLK
jgi:hypothetical protein